LLVDGEGLGVVSDEKELCRSCIISGDEGFDEDSVCCDRLVRWVPDENDADDMPPGLVDRERVGECATLLSE